MTGWSRETPWKQGQVLPDEAVAELGLRSANSPEKTLVVVISHDCDLAASPEKEPNVEVIIGQEIESLNGNFTHAKTARVLHLSFFAESGRRGVELRAARKTVIAKSDLVAFQPRRDLSLDPQGHSILQRWLAARYRRAAFPDAFERRLNESGAAMRLSKVLVAVGKHITAIFFDIDEGREIQHSGPEDTYTLAVVLLYTSEPGGRQSESVVLKAKEQIENVFRELFFKDGSWKNIELRECMVISDEALTYAQSLMLKQWRLEHLSLREEPPQSVMEQ